MRIVLLFIFQLIDCRRDQVDASTAQLPDDISNADLQRIKNVYCQSASRKFFEFCRNDPDIPDLPDFYPPEFIIFVIKVVRQSNELCDRYYQEFHNVSDLSLVSNSYVAAGGQGMVFKCECSQDNIDPAVTAQKVYYWTFDKNMTELAIVSTAVAEAGVRAPLYWFHDKGYFEEFMGHKKGNLKSDHTRRAYGVGVPQEPRPPAFRPVLRLSIRISPHFKVRSSWCPLNINSRYVGSSN